MMTVAAKFKVPTFAELAALEPALARLERHLRVAATRFADVDLAEDAWSTLR